MGSQPASGKSIQIEVRPARPGLITPSRGFGGCHSHDRTKMCQDEGNRLPMFSRVMPEPCYSAADFPLGVSSFMDHRFDLLHKSVQLEHRQLISGSNTDKLHVCSLNCGYTFRGLVKSQKRSSTAHIHTLRCSQTYSQRMHIYTQ